MNHCLGVVIAAGLMLPVDGCPNPKLRHIYDGQPHPVTGSPDYDSNTYHRIGNSINGVRFKNGKVVSITLAQLVPGKTYTVIDEGINADGQSYRDVGVFDRQ